MGGRAISSPAGDIQRTSPSPALTAAVTLSPSRVREKETTRPEQVCH